MKDRQIKTFIWDRYWQANRISSCAGRPGENYKPELLRGWRKFFQTLADGARILDLCTGNGAIPLVAVEVARQTGRLFHVTAIDKANIAPSQFIPDHREALSKINFVGCTDVSTMPCDEASFDAVTSQFGIEYTDLGRVPDQLVRLLAPNGRFRAVVHAREGLTVAAARHDISDCRYLVHESRLFKVARAALEIAWRHDQSGVKPGTGAKARYAKYRAAHLQVAERMAQAENPQILGSTLSVLADTYEKRQYFPLETLQDKIAEAETEVRAHLGRLEEMVAASLTEADIQAFVDTLEKSGLKSAKWEGEFSGEGGSQIGWVVSGGKD